MSLTIDRTGIKNFEDATEGDLVTSEVLGFATMVIGIPEITESNARDFFSRMSFYEKVCGATRTFYDGNEMKRLPITMEDVRANIGLRTNASRSTRPQFVKHIFEVHDRYIR